MPRPTSGAVVRGEAGFDDEGAPNYLNAWDGASWDYDLAALDGEVRLLSRVGSDLYLYGDFTSADDGNTPVQNLARWDGATIHALTDDVSGVLGMGDDDGRLFVVGAFYNHPGPACAHWDGAAWSAARTASGGQFGADCPPARGSAATLTPGRQ
ncbi:MAG: hypothetical protein IPM94_08395 [bacterium]|nr:hypothetical protein [bacterium]